MPDVLLQEVVIDGPIEGDFLNRHDFIKQVKNVIELLAKNKKNSCFAINGTWGIGKSYVLEKLEKQLLFYQNEETTLDQYFVFHFNCWEYDYYEEPLIAIVSSMLEEIRTKEHLFSENARAHILSAVKFVFSKLYESSSNWLNDKIGIDPKRITDGLTEIHNAAIANIDETSQYDKYLAFKQVLSTLRQEINDIAEERTIIFVVDELDRCIPEYQIKVLERLHHIFNEIDNMQVILSIDKSQLERTIKKMFGEHADTKKYLAKFIKFEIQLDEGTYNSQFEEIFSNYFNQFEGNDEADIVEFKENIFKGIAAREKIEIIEKCHLLHSMINTSDIKQHATFMCVEVFLTIVKHTNTNLPNASNGLQFKKMFGENATVGLNFLSEKMSCETEADCLNKRRAYYSSSYNEHYIEAKDLWGILLGSYAVIARCRIDGYYSNREMMKSVVEYTGQFWNLLQVIK